MTAARCFLFVILLILSTRTMAQHRVDLRNSYERLVCVVPMIGAGTFEDPRRPLYAPVPKHGPPSREGIFAFGYEVSDDGRFALVEFVALERAAFQHILDERRSDVKTFEKSTAKRAEIEKEFRKLKKDFDFERFGVRVP